MEQKNKIKLNIEKHLKSIKIIESIEFFEQKILRRKESVKDYTGVFPRLVEKYTNDIDTLERCIRRLKKSYQKLNS